MPETSGSASHTASGNPTKSGLGVESCVPDQPYAHAPILVRVQAAAKEETQIGLVPRRDYADFHRRWLFVGRYHSDDSLDASHLRVAAFSIKG
jgi:hypothetical protein